MFHILLALLHMSLELLKCCTLSQLPAYGELPLSAALHHTPASCYTQDTLAGLRTRVAPPVAPPLAVLAAAAPRSDLSVSSSGPPG